MTNTVSFGEVVPKLVVPAVLESRIFLVAFA